MTNAEKDHLRKSVRLAISLELDVKETVRRIERLGFKPATIRNYYKALKKS